MTDYSKLSDDDIERQRFERVVLDIAPYSTDLTRANGGLNYSDPRLDMAWIFFRAGWKARANLEKSDGALINEGTNAGISVKEADTER